MEDRELKVSFQVNLETIKAIAQRQNLVKQCLSGYLKGYLEWEDALVLMVISLDSLVQEYERFQQIVMKLTEGEICRLESTNKQKPDCTKIYNN